MGDSADLLRRAAHELRSPISRYFDRISKEALAEWLDDIAAQMDDGIPPLGWNAPIAVARAVLREPDPKDGTDV